MAIYLAATWLTAARERTANGGAVAFVTLMLALWIPWLLVSRAALARRRRWGFTPIVFTQLVFGGIALYDVAGANLATKPILALVVLMAAFCLYLAFSAPVRDIVAPRA